MSANVIFYDAIETQGIFANVGIFILRALESDGGTEAEPIFPQRIVPREKSGNDGGTGATREAGKSSGGGGGKAEKIHEGAFIERSVLVRENADCAAFVQDAQNGAGGIIFFYGPISGKATIAIHERVHAGIFDGAREKRQRIAVQSLGERRELPGAHVTGEKENSFGASASGFEIFKAVDYDETPDIIASEAGKVRELGGHPSEIADHAANYFFSPRIIKVRERKLQIHGTGAPQRRARPEENPCNTVSDAARDGTRKHTQELQHRPRPRVLEPFTHRAPFCHRRRTRASGATAGVRSAAAFAKLPVRWKRSGRSA